MFTNTISENSHGAVSNTAIICLSPYYGGMEMDAFKMAKMLCKNTNITLIIKKNSLIEKKHKVEAEKLGIDVESIDFFKNFSFSIIFGVRNKIKINTIKNIIYFGASELKSLYFSFLGLKINLLVRHGTTKSSIKKSLLHRLIYHDVNYHIAISRHLAENVKKIIPFGKYTQLKLIYPSLKTAPVKTPVLKNDTKPNISLLHVARITDGKGQIDAIKACKILYDMNKTFTLHLVGDMDPNYKNKFTSFLNDIPYRDSIKLEGFTSKISEYYRKSNIFIFPSKGEGFGNSFVEALSFGLVCISYKNTTFIEMDDLGFKFFLADNQNIESLKNSLLAALNHVEDNKMPMENNIQLAEKLFSEERERKEILSILI